MRWKSTLFSTVLSVIKRRHREAGVIPSFSEIEKIAQEGAEVSAMEALTPLHRRRDLELVFQEMPSESCPVPCYSVSIALPRRPAEIRSSQNVG